MFSLSLSQAEQYTCPGGWSGVGWGGWLYSDYNKSQFKLG